MCFVKWGFCLKIVVLFVLLHLFSFFFFYLYEVGCYQLVFISTLNCSYLVILPSVSDSFFCLLWFFNICISLSIYSLVCYCGLFQYINICGKKKKFHLQNANLAFFFFFCFFFKHKSNIEIMNYSSRDFRRKKKNVKYEISSISIKSTQYWR